MKFSFCRKVLKNVKVIAKGLSKKLLHKYTGPLREVGNLGGLQCEDQGAGPKGGSHTH